MDILNVEVERLGAAGPMCARIREAIPFPKQPAASVSKENTNEINFLCM